MDLWGTNGGCQKWPFWKKQKEVKRKKERKKERFQCLRWNILMVKLWVFAENPQHYTTITMKKKEISSHHEDRFFWAFFIGGSQSKSEETWSPPAPDLVCFSLWYMPLEWYFVVTIFHSKKSLIRWRIYGWTSESLQRTDLCYPLTSSPWKPMVGMEDDHPPFPIGVGHVTLQGCRTVGGRNPIQPHLGCMYKTVNNGGKLASSTGESRISQPSTVS